MPDEPKQETSQPSATPEISKTKSLTLQPSAEFVAEQATTTGPQISLPSSPAPTAVSPQETSQPVAPVAQPASPQPPTPLPDPINTPQAAAPVTVVEAAPLAQPVVPAAFQTSEQVAAAAKTQPHAAAPSQQFTLTSDTAFAENEFQASAKLYEIGTAVLGLASSMSYIGIAYFTSNLWVIGVVCAVLALAAIVAAFLSYRNTKTMTPLSVMGMAAATVTIVFIGNAIISYLAFTSASDNFSY